MVAIQEQKKQRTSKPPKKISWEAFQKKYLTREDKYKYEWLDGFVEKTPRTMDKKQIYIHENLLTLLDELKTKHSIIGRLMTEVDTFFDGKHRRPDIAFFTKKQILEAADDKNVVPAFVIEVVSTNDQLNKVEKKMEDYRSAGVQIIWQIFPELQLIHVYHDFGKKMVVCKGKDICSAEPVIEGFLISVEDIFKKG